MKIVVGLGNPGKEYEKTLHNLGWMAIDIVAEKLNCDFNKKSQFKGMLAETTVNSEKIILVKPLTYMNLSGECVSLVVNYYKADLKDMIVIYDDIDIESGDIRFKPSGSSGTHNGMRNIILHLNDTSFPRVRIGTKREEADMEMTLVDYVLSNIRKDKREVYEKAVARAADCALDFVKGMDVDRLMNIYNTKA